MERMRNGALSLPLAGIVWAGLCVVMIHGSAFSADGSDFADPGRLSRPPASSPGFPSNDPNLDVYPGFHNPPPGYGEVPFWWWTGDPLDRDRLRWQIREIKKKGVSGVQVNYAHEDTPGWPTYPNTPEIFTPDWWKQWESAAAECRKLGMGIGLSGYTLDWPGKDNLFGRLLYRDVELNGIQLELADSARVVPGNTLRMKIPKDILSVSAVSRDAGSGTSPAVELSGMIRNGELAWTPGRGEWQVYAIRAVKKPMTLSPIHPASGRSVIERFYQPFLDHAPNGSAAGLNYFFQDELTFGVEGFIWSDDFADEFKKRKGYDITPLLVGLFEDIGSATPKIRLDYADVKVQLSEERYFQPIFNWHWERGLIYGCDPGSRGKNPEEFGDYFRCVRWYTAPGHDTPGGSADLIKDKVSSSIAHLYGRPRVWLEGYHSLGWGATPSTLMKATLENYLFGCTLLNLHGLYYTTHGSFWEWAPPCYHFRMPYWEHMGVFLKYYERLSYLLSQGVHRCDVAIMYPVAPFDAGMGGKQSADTAFETGQKLMDSGRDFDFMDFQSLDRAVVRDGRLCVSGEAYRVLVLPGMRAVRWSTIEKALAFQRAGGIVIAVGPLPEASDRAGRNDPELDRTVGELFREQRRSGSNHPGGMVLAGPESVSAAIDRLVPKDVSGSRNVKALHRKIGARDVYMVLGAEKNSACAFRSTGRPELWDPWTGRSLPLTVISRRGEETIVRMPLEAHEAQIVVFSPGETVEMIESTNLDRVASVERKNGAVTVTGYAASGGNKTATVRVASRAITLSGEASAPPSPLTLEGDWEVELQPTMDNRWGDFRLPATDAVIGPEARLFRYAEEKGIASGWEARDFDDSRWEQAASGFGAKFWKLGPLPETVDIAALDRRLSALRAIDPAEPVEIEGRNYSWKPYSFSWRWGVQGDPGHQGWHGLKENVTDDFICLGAPKEGHNETLYTPEAGGTHYYLWTSAAVSTDMTAHVRSGGLLPAGVFVNGSPVEASAGTVSLNAGSNPLLLRYDGAGRGHFVLENPGIAPSKLPTPLAMRWFDRPGVIPFDVRPDEPSPAGWYRFIAPPGFRAMTVVAHGDLRAWADGAPLTVKKTGKTVHGAAEYRVTSKSAFSGESFVAFRVNQERGRYGGSAIPEPIRLECGKGRMQTGDWSKNDALEIYSGGMWYRKTVRLEPERIRGRVTLDLGEVAATAGVRVNGKRSGIRVAPPWTVDITDAVKSGENRIEVLVFNTLANHYLTIPTRYGGSPKSGLIGPVRVITESLVVLKAE